VKWSLILEFENKLNLDCNVREVTNLSKEGEFNKEGEFHPTLMIVLVHWSLFEWLSRLCDLERVVWKD
jgi:hypothetical protein